MKSIGTLSRWIACGVVAVAGLMATTTEAAVGRAVVRAVRGTAQYSLQGGEFKTLTVGRVLGPTSIVKTGVNSGVDLFLGENGPTVRLLADTTLELKTLNIDRTGIDVVIETFLDLTTGTIQGNVKTLAAASKYEVKTPFTVCAIKGTEYQISADGTVHAITGSVVVAYRVGQPTVTVNAGQTFVPPAQPTAQPIIRPTRSDEAPPTVPPAFPSDMAIEGLTDLKKVIFNQWLERGNLRVFEYGPQTPTEKLTTQIRAQSPVERLKTIQDLPVPQIIQVVASAPDLIPDVQKLPLPKQKEIVRGIQELLLSTQTPIENVPPPIRDFVSPTTGRPAGG
ncbi:MAG: hypothetical protein FJ398_14615 [Verrucomicrobia bacterium]|nr:hypothetical protein [Verrucomicrobiota bacterium]